MHRTRQTKTWQFALPKASSNSGVKMLKYSAIKSGQKFLKKKKRKQQNIQNIKNALYSGIRPSYYFSFFVSVHKTSALILYYCYYQNSFMRYCCYILLNLVLLLSRKLVKKLSC